MAVKVHVPTILLSLTNGQKFVESSGTTVHEVIAELDAQFPGFQERLIQNQKVARFMNVYVNDNDVRFDGGLTARVIDGDMISIIPAVAGGAR